MIIKVFLMLVLSVAFIESAKLLRKPKVYNAIITTDENLTPSQAFPIIQPVIQPAISILSPFYPTNIYESFAQNDVNDARREFKHEKPIERKSDEADVVDELNNNNQPRAEEPQRPTNAPGNVPENQPDTGKSPIPLNEYGFPPSLIPLQKFQAYPYSYPFIYDSYGNIQAIQQYPVLPPSYYPQQDHQLPPLEQPMFQVGARKLDQEQTREEKALPSNVNSISAVSSDVIKNNGNKNAEIPDVAIPPIPFSIKKN